jgi:hypothetical protein
MERINYERKYIEQCKQFGYFGGIINCVGILSKFNRKHTDDPTKDYKINRRLNATIRRRNNTKIY